MKINLIEDNGKHYIFHNLRNEKDMMFINRTWFIVKNIDKYKDNYKYLENLSFIWINNKYYDLIYDSKIMKELDMCNSIYETI